MLVKFVLNEFVLTKDLVYFFFNFRNEIAELEDVSFLHLKDTVSTIFLGENDITRVPPTFFKSFRRLIWLDLSKNHIREVAVGSLPSSLTTLSLSYNHFTKFPMALTDSLPELTWVCFI